MSVPPPLFSKRAQNCLEATLHLGEQVLQRHESWAASSARSASTLFLLWALMRERGLPAPRHPPPTPPPRLPCLNKALCSLLALPDSLLLALKWGKFLVCEDCGGTALVVLGGGSEVNGRHSAGHLPAIYACSCDPATRLQPVQVERKQSVFDSCSLHFFFEELRL